MPAYHEWPSTADGNSAASVPVTSVGIPYYFEAVDEASSAASYLKVLESTPYFVVDSRAPQLMNR
jgi:hypothetical protein